MSNKYCTVQWENLAGDKHHSLNIPVGGVGDGETLIRREGGHKNRQ